LSNNILKTNNTVLISSPRRELVLRTELKTKKDRNLDMVVSKDGKVVRIPAKEYEAMK
jgi:hypothetical protein